MRNTAAALRARDLDAELTRLRFVSQNFQELQGWRKLPAGAFLILNSEYAMHGVREAISFLFDRLHFLVSMFFQGSIELLLFAAPYLWGWMTIRYYERSFGRMEGPDGGVYSRFAGWPGTVLVVYFLMSILRGVDVRNYLPVSLTGLLVAYAFWATPGAWRERPYCGGLSLLFVAVSLGLYQVPTLHAKVQFYGPSSTVYHEMLWIACGLALIGVGLLDHRLLVRSLPPAPPEEGA